MSIPEAFFSALRVVAGGLVALLGTAMFLAYGVDVDSYAHLMPLPFPIHALLVLQSWLVLWAVVLRLLHKLLRERAANCPACPAHSRQRSHLRYVAAQLLLNNFGVIGLSYVVLVMRAESSFGPALAAGCIAMMLVSGAQTLYCLFGRNGELNDRRAPAQA